jgi:anti-sigma factor RsiW
VDCRDVQPLLHPYTDGELDLVRHLQIEHHLAECAACSDRQRGLRLLQDAIASAPLYHRAPDALRSRLAGPTRRRPSVVLVAAAVILLAVTTLTAGFFGVRSMSGESRLAEQVVASHVRSLQVEHLTDVASSDRHTVKPWFQGKLDFSPPVQDLSVDGFPLIGGRLDYLDDRPVAALVYRRRGHVINLFVWPVRDDDEKPVRSIDRQGFHACHWQRSGMSYWVVSDLNARELEEFAGLFQERASAPQP